MIHKRGYDSNTTLPTWHRFKFQGYHGISILEELIYIFEMKQENYS
jgi:hypothetical protein